MELGKRTANRYSRISHIPGPRKNLHDSPLLMSKMFRSIVALAPQRLEVDHIKNWLGDRAGYAIAGEIDSDPNYGLLAVPNWDATVKFKAITLVIIRNLQ